MSEAGTFRRGGYLATVFATCALLATVGCDATTKRGPARGPAAHSGSQSGLFDSVADNLDRLEQFDLNQMLPQICDRLNQWNQQEKPKVSWQLDPLVADLAPELRALPLVKTLDIVQFRVPDAVYLQQTVWLRDISAAARADQFDDVAVAQRLFDWVVRNIELEGDARTSRIKTLPHHPYQILLLGRGDAVERAWIFVLLARQQGLDAVLLDLADETGQTRPWAVAVLSGGQLYLFDCSLGLPIPSADGRGVATLDEVVSDESLLRKLDLDPRHPYPVGSEDLKRVVAYIEGSPQALSARMALVESRLSGKHKLSLTSPASALAQRLKGLAHVSEARLWPRPFEVSLWESKLTPEQSREVAREMFVFEVVPSLLKGRVAHLKGAYDGEEGAKRHLRDSRRSNAAIDNFKLPPELAKRIKKDAYSQVEAIYVVAMRQAKQDASFWLGLVLFDEKDYPTAIEYWDRFTLKDYPQGRWASAARYNLGRLYEAQGDAARAAALWESDGRTPQEHGNRLRARWLKQKSGSAEAAQAAARP